MNKYRIWIIILTIIAIIFLIYGIVYAKELTLEETKLQLEGNPYKIAVWMSRNIEIVKDPIGYAQPAEYTFKYKKGDCEDWAILSRYFIGDKYETHLVVWIGKFKKDSEYYKIYLEKKVAHCILAIKINEDNWGVIDYDRYIIGGKSLANIVKLDCYLRKINVEIANIVDMYKYKYEIIEEINLEE